MEKAIRIKEGPFGRFQFRLRKKNSNGEGYLKLKRVALDENQ